MKKVVLLRHGETTSSSLGLYTGRADVLLSERGREQARSWIPPLSTLRDAGATVASSPLSRCIDTASAAGATAVEVWPELAEWDLGSLDGRNAAAVRGANPEWVLFRDGVPDGSGESVEEVRARAETAWSRAREHNGDVVLVTHGQFAKLMVATILGLGSVAAAALSLGPARAAVLIERPHGPSLAGWNLVPDPDRLWVELT